MRTGDRAAPEGAPRSPSVLIVDDDEAICEVLSSYLRPQGYRIAIAHTGSAAMERLRGESPDVAILDLRLSDMSGQEIHRYIHDRHLSTEVIIITGFASLDSALEAIKNGAFDYIIKPFKLAEIEISVRNAMERLKLRRQNRMLMEKVRELSERIEKMGGGTFSPTIRFEELSAEHPMTTRSPAVGPYGETVERKYKSNP